MSFEAKDHMDVTTPIPMDETLAKLRRVMPEKHPVLRGYVPFALVSRKRAQR